jgi:hypothetical protein
MSVLTCFPGIDHCLNAQQIPTDKIINLDIPNGCNSAEYSSPEDLMSSAGQDDVALPWFWRPRGCGMGVSME